MNIKRIWAMFVARSREFYRDRSAFGWNVVFPFLIVGGFAIIFGGDERAEYKVGIFPCASAAAAGVSACVPPELASIRYVGFIPVANKEQGLDKLSHHKIDMLVQIGEKPFRYWVSDASPKGYIVQRMIAGGLISESQSPIARQPDVSGVQIRYIDWFFPGIVGMSMMFSALYGVGYVIVRYRKNGVLKRLEATPLTAVEYLTAQMLSRLCMIAFSVTILWIGSNLVFRFTMEGSYLDLAVMLIMGSLSLISLGLVIASRGTSEEFTDGLLNFLTWPMMFLSGVWFSIEGAPGWIQTFSKLFPLTHILSGARKIMNDGVGLSGVRTEMLALAGMTLCFVAIGALLFKWNR